MDLSEIIKAIGEEIERLQKAKELLAETLEKPAPKAKRGEPKKAAKKASKKVARKKSTNGRTHRRQPLGNGASYPPGGTDDGGYGAR